MAPRIHDPYARRGVQPSGDNLTAQAVLVVNAAMLLKRH
jgi:hypothetical protein